MDMNEGNVDSSKEHEKDKSIRASYCKFKGCDYSTRWGHMASHVKKHHTDAAPRYSKRYSGINKRQMLCPCPECGFAVSYTNWTNHIRTKDHYRAVERRKDGE